MEDEALTERIIGCALKVHRVLGPGFLESVYEKALAYELRKAGLTVLCQRAITVRYEGLVVGEFVADLVVEGRLIVENKAVQKLGAIQEVQLVNYLTATGIEIGLLLNFGAPRLEIRRKYKTYRNTRQERQEGQEDRKDRDEQDEQEGQEGQEGQG